MASPTTNAPSRLRHLILSAVALMAAVFVIMVLSLVTDQVFHSLGVYPPWGEPMLGTADNVLALSYRIVYTVLGGYLAARLAPYAPMGHALALGAVGVVLGTAGAIAAWDMSPGWFLIALVLIALPGSWLGGLLYDRRQGDS